MYFLPPVFKKPWSYCMNGKILKGDINMSEVKLDFLMDLEEVIKAGVAVTGISFKALYDGDHKSGGISVDNGEYEVFISSNDVAEYEE
jgi:hypothetical protein